MATFSSTSQRITINGAYKDFTGGSGNTTTVIQYSSGDAPVSGDEERFLLWKNGTNTGDWEVRFIESATSSAVTVTDGGFSSAPPSGASFAISTNLADIDAAFADTIVRSAGRSYQIIDRDFALTNGAFVADVNASLTSKSTQTGGGFISTYPVANNCALQFGRLVGGEANDSVETIGGCQLLLEVSNNTLMFTNQGSFNSAGPVLNFYGCLIESIGNGNDPFIRAPGPMRIIGCVCDGPMGGRLYSSASELVDTRFSGNETGGVAWSLGASFTRPIDNAFFYQNVAAIKSFEGFTGTFSNTRFADSNTYIIQAQANSGLLFKFVDCTTFGVSKINGNTGNYEQLKSINYTITDAGGTGLTGVKVAVYDTLGGVQGGGVQTSSSGTVPEINTRFFRKSHNVSTPINYAPFDIRIRRYGYTYLGFQSAVSEPIKQEVRLVVNPDIVSTEAQAAAITGISLNFATETATITQDADTQKLYDYYQYQLDQTANTVYSEDLVRAGNSFDLDDWDMVVDGATYTGDITTTGNVTFLNGANIVGEVNGEYRTFDGDTITVPYAKIVADTSSSITITLDGITATELEIRGGGTLNVNGTNNAKAYTATLTQTSGTIVLDGDLIPSSNYSEDVVNRTITLSGSGTETSLEGLRGLIQVDFETAGTRTNYTSTARFITETGSSLIIDADVETLSFASDTPFPNFDYKGTLQLGRKTTSGGVTKYSNGVALVFNRQGANDSGGGANGQRAFGSSANGSSFTGYGGEIVSAAAVCFCGFTQATRTGSVLIEKLDFFGRLAFNGNAAQCRFDNSAGQSVVVSGITFRSALTANATARGIVLFSTTFTSFSGRFLAFTLQSFINQLRGLRFDNLEFADNFRQFDLARNQGGEVLALVNSDLGSSASIQNVNAPDCHFAFLGEVHISVSDTDKVAISTAKYYIADNDDGQRVAPIGDTQDITSLVTNYGTSGSNVYSGVVNASGEATEMILLSTKTANTVHSDYSNGGSLSDQMDVFVIDYGYNLGATSAVLRGADGTAVDFILPEDSLVTETSKTTVDAYATLDTPNEVYDRAKAELVDAYAGETQTIVTRSGSQLDARALDVVIDATAAQAFDLTGSTLTIKSSEYVGDMITTGTITLQNGATFTGTRTDANGTLLPLRNISITGITAGSRLQIYNVTTATEAINTLVPGTSYTATYAEGTGYNSGDTVRIRLTQISTTTAKLSFETTVLATDAGWTALVSQQDDTVYNTFAVDGSTVTIFTADYINDQVDVTVASDFNLSDMYAWWVHNLTTAQGIREFFGGITAEDQANFRINTSVLSLFLDNTTNTQIIQLDNRRIYRTDLTYPVIRPSTGGGGIDVQWRDQILIAETPTSGLTTTESEALDKINKNAKLIPGLFCSSLNP